MSDPNTPPKSNRLITLGDSVPTDQPIEPDFSELQMATVTIDFDGSPVDDDDLRRGFELTGLTAEEKKLKNLKRKRAVEHIELAKKIKLDLKKEKKKAQKEEDETNVEDWKHWKHYWNLILNTFFFTMNEMDNYKREIEKEEFQEMIVNIYKFDEGADWAKYKRWNMPLLTINLLGSYNNGEELNDAEHKICRSLKFLADKDTHKKNVKRVLAYLHHCQSQRSEETRVVHKMTNKSVSQTWDWILCDLQSNLKKYVDSQEKLRGKMVPKPKYGTLWSFSNKLNYYEKRKNKDMENAFLYECYEFFKNHVHIESEVLNADFQELWTCPKKLQSAAELAYFKTALGFDGKTMLNF